MIRRDRKQLPVPDALSKPGSLGEKELAEVRAWIDATRSGERPQFRAYKSREVTAALEALFERKCAYCETVYVATQPIDVEHWRPKAEVDVEGPHGGKTSRHGYEWLAADWHNLLPSCIDCNRAREQVVLGKEPGKVEKRTSGKANQFPVEDEATRLRSWRDDLAKERPRLLDPCDPEFDGARFFEFLATGVIAPRDPANATEAAAQRRRDRALESIRVYALNRKALVEARRERLLLVLARCELIRSLIAIEAKLRAGADSRGASHQLLGEAADELQALVEKELAALAALAAAHQPYSLMTQQFVAAFRDELTR